MQGINSDRSPIHRARALGFGALLALQLLSAAAADDTAAPMQGEHPMNGMKGMPGAGGMGMPMGGNNAVREHEVNLTIPPLKLVRDDGRAVQLDRELNDGRPVLINFIYTTCFGICPISSQTFSQFQARLGGEAEKVHLVSVSIDPEEDTPSVLHKYAKKYNAGPSWNHYTGTSEASISAQKAFQVYKGDKMNHDPFTLMRAAPGKPWVRIDGFATAEDLLRTYRRLLGNS